MFIELIDSAKRGSSPTVREGFVSEPRAVARRIDHQVEFMIRSLPLPVLTPPSVTVGFCLSRYGLPADFGGLGMTKRESSKVTFASILSYTYFDLS